jgi:hypothetical protein
MEVVRFILEVACFVAGVGATVALLFVVPLHFDRIVVILLRRLRIPLYPTAIGIAVAIVNQPEQWSSDGYKLSHPDIGSIWIANGAFGIKLDTNMGKWSPNYIERRIIREAVDWRIGAYIRDRLEVALRKNARGPAIRSVTELPDSS